LPSEEPLTNPDDSEAQLAAPVQPTERRFTRWQRFQIWLISVVASLAIRLIGPTLRFTLSPEEGSPDVLEKQTAIWVFWHRCVFPAAWRFRNRNIAVMTSRSYDGEYIARTIERLGFQAVRGSSSRGGAVALRGMHRQLEEGHSVAFTIDGPRGPRYVAKPGPVLLASKAQLPILGFYIALDRPWVLNSWDRFMIPKPFSRAFVRSFAPITVPPNADPETIQQYHKKMQESLDRITAYAEDAVGRRKSR
jgi:lysophospholipid acyltransferase (LPLAT)-like uncharacterized protein